MEILNQSCPKLWRPLRNVPPGTCVQFSHPFHQKHKEDDLFLVGDGTYNQDHNRGFVMNLRTGYVSYVELTRKVREIDASVCVNE